MIHWLAVKWVNLWADNQIIDAQKEEIYQYGLELLISTFLNCALMIVASCVIHIPFAFIPYTAVYVPLRLTAGGYHASNHLRCIAYTQCTFILFVLATKFLSEWEAYTLFPMIILSGIIIFCFSPVESENNPLSAKEAKRARNRSYILELFVMSIAIACVYWNCLHIFIVIGIAANSSVAFSLVTAKINLLWP